MHKYLHVYCKKKQRGRRGGELEKTMLLHIVFVNHGAFFYCSYWETFAPDSPSIGIPYMWLGVQLVEWIGSYHRKLSAVTK